MSDITDEQKQEIKDSIENAATTFTDTVSLVYDALGLDGDGRLKTPHKPLKDLNKQEDK
jgi:hypothetical protein